MLRKAAQGQQQPRQDLPENRQTGEDDPLPGPWNRRAETDVESSLPGPWDIPGEPRGDMPLPGPWENKSPRERPMETTMEPRWEPESEPAQPRRDTGMGTPVSRRDTLPVSAGECEAVDPQNRRAVVMQQERFRRRRRKCRVNPLTAVLDSHSTLVGSMVLGQVLGTRGGLAGERKKTSSKNF